MNKIIATKGKYQLVRYEAGFFAVDYVTKSVGMTLKADDNFMAVKAFFNNLNAKKRP